MVKRETLKTSWLSACKGSNPFPRMFACRSEEHRNRNEDARNKSMTNISRSKKLQTLIQMTKILVTGGAGFIGSHIVDRLIGLGHEVIVVDNLSTGKEENLNKQAKFYNEDILNFEKLEEIFKKEQPEIINHHAAQASVSISVTSPQADAKINIIGTINLLELARKYHAKKFIYINSGGAGYGEPEYLPMKEEHSINPLSPYGISKHTAEHYLILYHHLHNLPYVCLRYANVYGPRQDPAGEAGVVAIFTKKLLNHERPTIFGDGSQVRDYIYVKDVVDANVLAIMNKSLDNNSFNVGTGKTTSTQEIFDNLRRLTSSDLEPIYADERKGDLKASSIDSSKLQQFGWKPNYTLEQGLKETIAYFNRK